MIRTYHYQLAVDLPTFKAEQLIWPMGAQPKFCYGGLENGKFL